MRFRFFDKDSILSTKSAVTRFCTIRNSVIGDYSYVGPSSNFVNVDIGKFCSISKNVNIGAYLHPTDHLSSSPIFFRDKNGTGTSWVQGIHYDDYPKKVYCGHDVWIGMNTTIMGGVKIGNGAIIAAHSVITKDVPDYAIVGGVPAKIIKYRFQKDVIDQLMRISWWDYNSELLKNNVSELRGVLNDRTIEILKRIQVGKEQKL